MTPFEWGTQQFAELKTFQNKPGKTKQILSVYLF